MGNLAASAKVHKSIMMKPSEALAALRAELRDLASRQGLKHPRIFGSVLTGNDDEESDLDLLVDPAETTSLLTLAAFKREAEALLGVPVSVLTPDALPLKFRSEVLRKAQLYEASGASRRLPWAYCPGERARSYVLPWPDLHAFEQNPLCAGCGRHISRMPLSSSLSIRSSDGRICATCAMSLLTPISR
jgi:uncharacterized protein